MTPKDPVPGILHQYSPHLIAFEHTSTSPSTTTTPHSTILFIPGLGDGLLTVPYTTPLSHHLSTHSPTYTLTELLLSSAYTGFGSTSLTHDVTEIAQCVSYFRSLRPGGKIVLMGHSTGSQDVLHYLVSPSPGERPRIDGAIMQASVSDREGMNMMIDEKDIKRGVEHARRFEREGRGQDILPTEITGMMFPAPVSARRFLSLVSPGPEHSGEDDYFSSDLSEERLNTTFGKVGSMGAPMLILFSGGDQHVPEGVDKKGLVERWVRCIREGGGVVDEGTGVIEGASHTLKELGKPAEDVFERVVAFLKRLEKDT